MSSAIYAQRAAFIQKSLSDSNVHYILRTLLSERPRGRLNILRPACGSKAAPYGGLLIHSEPFFLAQQDAIYCGRSARLPFDSETAKALRPIKSGIYSGPEGPKG